MEKKEVAKLMELAKGRETVDSVCSQLHISKDDLLEKLKQLKGAIELRDKFYYNGEKTVSLALPSDQRIGIVTNPGNMRFRAIAISDLHIGSSSDCIPLLSSVYDLAIKNGIHNIINGGDLLDGYFGPGFNRENGNYQHLTPTEQLNFVLDKTKMPYDRAVRMFTTFGDHDESFLHPRNSRDKNYTRKLDYAQPRDVAEIITAGRDDYVNLGYGAAQLFLKNDFILIKHPISHKGQGINISDPNLPSNGLILQGHSHRIGFEHKNDNQGNFVRIPTASLMSLGGSNPGILVLDIEMNDGFMDHGYIVRYEYINGKFVKPPKDTEHYYRIDFSDYSRFKSRRHRSTVDFEEDYEKGGRTR